MEWRTVFGFLEKLLEAAAAAATEAEEAEVVIVASDFCRHPADQVSLMKKFRVTRCRVPEGASSGRLICA